MAKTAAIFELGISHLALAGLTSAKANAYKFGLFPVSPPGLMRRSRLLHFRPFGLLSSMNSSPILHALYNFCQNGCHEPAANGAESSGAVTGDVSQKAKGRKCRPTKGRRTSGVTLTRQRRLVPSRRRPGKTQQNAPSPFDVSL